MILFPFGTGGPVAITICASLKSRNTIHFPSGSIDLIQEVTLVLGFVDDATVTEFVADKTRQTLDDFVTWETTALQ
jgi:hypothetical protein